jgi:hypothetical protein
MRGMQCPRAVDPAVARPLASLFDDQAKHRFGSNRYHRTPVCVRIAADRALQVAGSAGYEMTWSIRPDGDANNRPAARQAWTGFARID